MFIRATDAIQSQKLPVSLNKTPPPLGDHLVRLVPWYCSIASGYSNGPEKGSTSVTYSKYLYSIFYCNWSFFLFSLSFSLASCFVVAYYFTLHNPRPHSDLILLPQNVLWLPFVCYRITSTEARQKSNRQHTNLIREFLSCNLRRIGNKGVVLSLQLYPVNYGFC